MLWTPGQHVFIRFLTLGLHSFTAHPFSICSLPASPRENRPSELVFYIRPRGGFTSRLANIAGKQPNISLPVLLDGPYGGVNALTLTKFDMALVIAGGSGAGYTLPLIEDIARRFEEQYDTVSDREKEVSVRPRKTVLQVVVATRDHPTRQWYLEAVDELLSRYPAFLNSKSLHVSVYFTGASPRMSSDPDLNPSAGPVTLATTGDNRGYSDPSGPNSDLSSMTTSDFHCRPNLPQHHPRGNFKEWCFCRKLCGD